MKEHRTGEARGKLSIGEPGGETRTLFQVVAAYDDAPARDRAVNLFHRLKRQLGRDYELECSWWRLDHLREALLLQKASDEATQANMIILSLRETPELPQSSQAWIRSWVPRRGSQKAALVALVAGEKRQSKSEAPLLPSLESVAKDAQMDFFLQWFDPSSPPPSTRTANHPEPVLETLPQPPAALLTRQPSPRWGINE